MKLLVVFSVTLAGLMPAGLFAQQAEPASSPETAVNPLVALSKLEASGPEEYTISEGDEVDIQVVGRPELSGSHLVGPDGRITLPIAGPFEIRDMTRDEAAARVTTAFERYYTTVDVTVRVSKYGASRILVLGHVDEPGVLYFDGVPTLFDVLTKSRRPTLGAGTGQSGMPKRCAIFRGKEQVVWIDLKSILDAGGAGADIRLRRNDVVYVPDEVDDQVSVLGEVQRPGMVRLGPRTNLSEVLAMSGGLTAGAGAAKIQIIRPGTKATQEIAFKDLVDSRKSIEASLQSGDVIYVQKGTMAKVYYTIQQLAPAGTMMMFATAVK